MGLRDADKATGTSSAEYETNETRYLMSDARKLLKIIRRILKLLFGAAILK